MPSSERTVLYEAKEGVAHITLNRPEVLNSVNHIMARELRESLSRAAEENTARAILLSGSGKAFCAGQDLAEITEMGESPDLGEIVRERYNPIIRLIRHTEKPVICAVSGVAAGAGASLALACDLVIASSKSSFVQSFSKVGLIPDSGGTFFLPRLVGLARATALMMLAEKLPAEEALRIGLIYRVVDGDVLEREALALAAYLANQPTCGLGFIKRAINRSFANDLDTHLDLEEELQRLAGRTIDFGEGVRAFVEKRQPKFSGT